MRVIVTRAFILGGERQEVGAEIEISDRGLLALLVSTGKARAAEASTEPAGPMTTETAAGLTGAIKRGKSAKE